MNITEDHIAEIDTIVAEYSRIEEQMSNLVDQANLLNQKKQAIELDLLKNREAERLLIDKIKEVSGDSPTFVEILENINN